MGPGDLDAERGGELAEPPPALERQHPPGQRDGAEHRRVGPLEAGAREGLPEHATVERGVVGDEHPSRETGGELREDDVAGRRAVHHRLRDAGEPLDPPTEGGVGADEGRPALVQLAAAGEHGGHLGELAALAAAAVGLGVDDEELRLAQRGVQHGGHERREYDAGRTGCTPRCGGLGRPPAGAFAAPSRRLG